MDFDLTEDQLALRAGATELLDDLASPARVRAHTTTDAPFDGALWRARHEWPAAESEALHEGDSVVVERVSGLTLCVRRADEWELTA